MEISNVIKFCFLYFKNSLFDFFEEWSNDVFVQVLHTICEGVVAFLLDRSDHAKAMMRSVARELLATCVFRPLLGLVTPYYINKVLQFFPNF